MDEIGKLYNFDDFERLISADYNLNRNEEPFRENRSPGYEFHYFPINTWFENSQNFSVPLNNRKTWEAF